MTIAIGNKNIGLTVAGIAIAASGVLAGCSNENDTPPPAVTTVWKWGDTCLGYKSCPTGTQYVTSPVPTVPTAPPTP